MKNPVAGRRNAGGRHSQYNFCIKLSVHEKVVVGSRLSLFMVVAEARFYCIAIHIGHVKNHRSAKVGKEIAKLKIEEEISYAAFFFFLFFCQFGIAPCRMVLPE